MTKACLTYISKRQGNFEIFARVLLSRNIAIAKFRENKTLAKLLEFTVSKSRVMGLLLSENKFTSAGWKHEKDKI